MDVVGVSTDEDVGRAQKEGLIFQRARHVLHGTLENDFLLCDVCGSTIRSNRRQAVFDQ